MNHPNVEYRHILYHPLHLQMCKFKTQRLCTMAVSLDGRALEFVGKPFINAELCKAAVSNNTLAFEFVPEKFQTYQMCLDVVKRNGSMLQYVSPKYHCTEMYIAAVTDYREHHWERNTNPGALEFINEKTDSLVYILAIEGDPQSFYHIKPEWLDEDICDTAVQKNGMNLTNVPDHLRTQNVVKHAVEHTPEIIGFLFHCKQNEPLLLKLGEDCCRQICEIAVSAKGKLLASVPRQYHTPDLCIKAVKQSPEAIKYIKIRKNYPELIKANPDTLKYINKQRQKELPSEVLENIVWERPDTLKYIKQRVQTQKICENAIKSPNYNGNPGTFQLLPDKRKHHELCLIAATKNYINLQHIPESCLTYQIVQSALFCDPRALQFTPDQYKTQELCEIAFNKYHLQDKPLEPYNSNFQQECVLKHIPDKLKTVDMCEKALRVDRRCLQFVPKEMITYDMVVYYFSAGEDDYAYFRDWDEHIPRRHYTEELYMTALKHDNHLGLFELVPDQNKTLQLCVAAINNREWELKYVPDDLITYDMCIHAVENWGKCLKHVPDRFKTKQICTAALRSHRDAFKYLPDGWNMHSLFCKWSQKNHTKFPQHLQDTIFAMLLVHQRLKRLETKKVTLGTLPKDILYMIFRRITLLS